MPKFFNTEGFCSPEMSTGLHTEQINGKTLTEVIV